MKILADSGEMELVEQFSDSELDTLKDLHSRLKTSEALALELRDKLHMMTRNSGIVNKEKLIEEEMSVRLELRNTQEKLEKLQRIVGREGEAKTKELVAKVEEGERKVHILEAQLKATEAVSLLCSTLRCEY
jgi:hypothetical protein